MGSTEFHIIVKAETAKAAFEQAVNEAIERYGNDPYSGTIATVDSFKVISGPAASPVGEVLREARLAEGMTLKEVGALVGRTGGWVSDVEKGRIKRLSEDHAKILDKALKADGAVLRAAKGIVSLQPFVEEILDLLGKRECVAFEAPAGKWHFIGWAAS